MTHDVEKTREQVSRHIRYAVDSLLKHNFHFGKTPAEEHESIREDGEPVASVVLDDFIEIYPFSTTEIVGIAKREVPVQKWAIDKLVDDSDPSVGIYGVEPMEHSEHRNLDDAIIEAGKMLLENRIRDSMRQEDHEDHPQCQVKK